ncbi:MAG: ABC transporter ATP-binding protein [Pseudomonadaceae bacterium]|nr:ABC transporter ATP-binding protein [Pseudomonadaceae bacterium]
MNCITYTNVRKSFGPKTVLNGVNLKVEKGNTHVILGGSGSGKSVMLKCLLGLIEPDEGTITVDGLDTTHMPSRERMEHMHKFGMLFQAGALFDSMNVWQNVAFALMNEGMKPADARDVAVQKLKQVGLKADTADLNPADLSGGMRKRVALARAIAHNPQIILYDEPTTGLDPITSDVINDLILQLQSELKATSVVITHDMHTAFKVADKISFLYQGKFIAEGTAKEFKSTDNPYVKQFVAGSAQGPIQGAV